MYVFSPTTTSNLHTKNCLQRENEPMPIICNSLKTTGKRTTADDVVQERWTARSIFIPFHHVLAWSRLTLLRSYSRRYAQQEDESEQTLLHKTVLPLLPKHRAHHQDDPNHKTRLLLIAKSPPQDLYLPVLPRTRTFSLSINIRHDDFVRIQPLVSNIRHDDCIQPRRLRTVRRPPELPRTWGSTSRRFLWGASALRATAPP